jgi:hypothetical protein
VHEHPGFRQAKWPPTVDPRAPAAKGPGRRGIFEDERR